MANTLNQTEENTPIHDIFLRNRKNVKRNKCLATCMAILGLIALLIVLTTRINAIAYVSNIMTIVAFLAVIINLLVKDCYKKDSLERYEAERREIIEDLESYKVIQLEDK